MSLPHRRFTNAAKVPSGLATGERREFMAHRKYVRGFVCLVCDAYNLAVGYRIEFAHVRLGTDGGTGLKPHDCWGLPLCDEHHAEQHRIGEASFAVKYPKAFPRGMKAAALVFARNSPVQEVKERARQTDALT